MSVALSLPDPKTITIADVPKVVARVAAARRHYRERHDTNGAVDLKRKLDALYAYIADKHVRQALAGEQRLTEVLIGELLGRPHRGKTQVVPAKNNFAKAQIHDFRHMADHAKQVTTLVEKGTVNRAAILRALPIPLVLEKETPKPKPHPTFNQVNDNIGWARWSWNPVTGCLHNCEYCYARDIAEQSPAYPQKFEPTFLPERLTAPAHTHIPADANDDPAWRRVFTCSMADLFGKWVPQEWIRAVFEQIRTNQQWEFLCLTKFPDRLAEIEWPANVWAGTTVDRQHRVANAERSFRGVKAGVKWLSCEPLLEPLEFTSLEMFDWVVIGASTGSKQAEPFAPPFEWVAQLYDQARAAGCRVYLKHNLFGAHEGRAPGMQPVREWPR